MNDFFIYAFVAENLGDVVGLVALDGFDAFAVVVDDALGNDEAFVHDVDDVSFVELALYSSDAYGQQAGTVLDEGVAAAAVYDKAALDLASRQEPALFRMQVRILGRKPGADVLMRRRTPFSPPEAMTMSTPDEVAMDAACIFVYMPPVPIDEPAPPAIS